MHLGIRVHKNIIPLKKLSQPLMIMFPLQRAFVLRCLYLLTVFKYF